MTKSHIDPWLHCEERLPALPGFTIFDVSEYSSITTLPIQFLSELLHKFLFEEQVLQDLRDLLGPQLRQALAAVTPSTPSLRAGVFGEALSAEIIEHWHAYLVPLKRLRTTGGSPPGTDLLALRVEDGNQLTEICYIESKLRTVPAAGVAIDAYQQLIKVREEQFPLVSLHLANYLKAIDSPLYPSFIGYLTSRASQPIPESYRIALTWEENLWTETVLENLVDKGIDLQPLSIDVIKIKDLRSLIKVVYDSLGIEALGDGE